MHLPIPPSVIYAGLAGTLLALIVATAQQKWKPRVFFLLALRLAIGWQFFFEGAHKIHSHLAPQTSTSRPFSSEPYFRDADGPLGPMVRAQIGDPDAKLASWLDVQNVPDDLKTAYKFPAEFREPILKKYKPDQLVAFLPPAVKTAWTSYVDRFKAAFPGVDAAEVDKSSEKSQANYVLWAIGCAATDSKVKFFTGDVAYSVPHRYLAMQNRKAEYELQIRQRDKYLGYGDSGYQKTLKDAKTDAISARDDLQKDADAMFASMKADLAALVASKLAKKAPSPGMLATDEAKLEQFLIDAPAKPSWDVLPPALRQMWENYPETYKGLYFANTDVGTEKRNEILQQISETKARFDTVFGNAKLQLANWYANLDDVSGQPKPVYGKLLEAYRKAPDAKAKTEAGEALMKALDSKFAAMKAMLNTAITSTLNTATVPADTLSNFTGAILPDAPTPSSEKLKQMDKLTMWFIAGVGACIFFGLFTRIACVAAAGFLLMTYLTHPPVPWLPLPPGTEGNPLFINKNAIEFFALLALACIPTGKWLGLDSILAWMFTKNKNEE